MHKNCTRMQHVSDQNKKWRVWKFSLSSLIPYAWKMCSLQCSLWRSLAAGTVMHSHSYRVPEPYSGQSVVVLGAGASGLDISMELAGANAQVPNSVLTLAPKPWLDLPTPLCPWQTLSAHFERVLNRVRSKQRRSVQPQPRGCGEVHGVPLVTLHSCGTPALWLLSIPEGRESIWTQFCNFGETWAICRYTWEFTLDIYFT